MNTNKRKAMAVFIGCLALTLLSAGNVFGQEFNSVESLVKSRLKRGFGNLCISDTSPEANKRVFDLTHNFHNDAVIIRYFFESEKPLSKAAYSLFMRDVSLELASASIGFAEEEYYRQLASLDPETATEVRKAIGVVVTQAIVQNKKTEFEVYWSAEHPDGRELYGLYGFYSAPKPVADIESILTQTNNPTKKIPSGVSERSAAMSGSETVKTVDELLFFDPRLKKILERMDQLREE
jgi:hypothetical protein